jgi:hypothetical protein
MAVTFDTSNKVPFGGFCEISKVVFLLFLGAKSTSLIFEKLMCHRKCVTWSSNELLISTKTVKISGFTLGE